jgi:uracil-DNA glycosylase
MNNKNTYLKEMEIDIWQSKKPIAATSSIPTSDWEKLEEKVKHCTLCQLHKSCTNIVFGVGNKNAEILFIGEAPGANEDLQGEPFVGKAGMLLNEMVRSIGLKRSDIYITNILKCRPPNNRDPQPEEIKHCTPHLQAQITLIKPKLIVALGRIAAHFLLNTTESMSRLRGQIHQYEQQIPKTPLIVTYHPAYLLRSPSEKRKAYQDFLLIKKSLQ